MKRVVLCWFLVCLCTLNFVLSVSVLMGGDLSCARWKLKGFVTGRSLFRRPLSGTTFLPTSDTAVSSHSSKLLSKLTSSLLLSLGYLDPLDNFFSLLRPADVCSTNLLVIGSERVS